ncbi:hypothetical protein GH714_031581 [Hevea brasiliensis]|uniref:Uncharacterized protein n=1 Tax=Hevea brasiliensis TaxID=3981 RepID=A0A6A6LW08_HEVBR|nr:hypothetical protein GH714_031581 [Hevea brasiliensis]
MKVLCSMTQRMILPQKEVLDQKIAILKESIQAAQPTIILDVTSDMAAVEVGGGPWFNTWKGKTTTPELLSRALRVPLDVDGIFNFLPLFKPPGL